MVAMLVPSIAESKGAGMQVWYSPSKNNIVQLDQKESLVQSMQIIDNGDSGLQHGDIDLEGLIDGLLLDQRRQWCGVKRDLGGADDRDGGVVLPLHFVHHFQQHALQALDLLRGQMLDCAWTWLH